MPTVKKSSCHILQLLLSDIKADTRGSECTLNNVFWYSKEEKKLSKFLSAFSLLKLLTLLLNVGAGLLVA